MKKKSRNKHLLKKRRAKAAERAIQEAIEKGEDPCRDILPEAEKFLDSLHVGDVFTFGDDEYTVSDTDIVGGYIACVNNRTGEQDWVPAETSVA